MGQGIRNCLAHGNERVVGHILTVKTLDAGWNPHVVADKTGRIFDYLVESTENLFAVDNWAVHLGAPEMSKFNAGLGQKPARLFAKKQYRGGSGNSFSAGQ